MLSQSGPIVPTASDVDFDGAHAAGGVTLDLESHTYFRGREVVLAAAFSVGARRASDPMLEVGLLA